MDRAGLRPRAGLAAGRPRAHFEWVTRRAPALLLGLSGVLAALTLARLPASWESGNGLNHVSGAWMTLADDLARGTFYRPLEDPALGFGGTRFFPLAFTAHAALLRAGAPLLASGFALSLATGLLLVGALALLLRRLGLARRDASALAALALAGLAGQHALSAVRGDLLAVALEVAGLAAIAGAAPARGVPLGALLFTLAFAAKPTALTAPAAAAAALALGGARRPALALGLLTGAGAALVVGATEALSEGRFLAVLAQSASGGMGPADVVRAPLRLARAFLVGDRAGLLLVAAGAAAIAAALLAARGRPEPGARAAPAGRVAAPWLAGLWLMAAAGGALAVFASPGTGVNHLLELEVAAAAALGAALAAGGLPGRVAARGAPAAALAGIAVAVGFWREDLGTSRLAEARAAIAAAPGEAALLSEDPLLPLLAGERPVILDPWMLRLAASGDPSVERPLLGALAARAPRAVILFQDLSSPDADAWYAHGNFGPGPVAEVRRSFRLASRFGRYFVYVPLPPPAPPKEKSRAVVVAASDATAGRPPAAVPVPHAGAGRAGAAAGRGGLAGRASGAVPRL